MLQRTGYGVSPARQGLAGGTGNVNVGSGYHQHAGSFGPSQIERHEPNLRAFEAPRPNKNYAGSIPSLPSSVSSFKVSETGLEVAEAKYAGNKSGGDIRLAIGLEHNIHKTGNNTWKKYNWADPHGRDNDEALRENWYLTPFIRAWMAEVPDNVLVSLNQDDPEYWRCDIDPSTGSFLPPIVCPDSMVNHWDNLPELEWRRQNWSSTLLIRRQMTSPYRNPAHARNIQRDNFRNQSHEEAAAILDEHLRNQSHEEAEAILDEHLIVKVHENEVETSEYNHYVPRIPCHLRPAEMGDAEAVRLIYNWEVEHGLQAPDSHPLSTEDVENIITTAQALGMPFIVAVRGSGRDLGLTKGNLSFSPFPQVEEYETSRRGEVIGFAYLSVWGAGLAGSGDSTGRATAKIHVFVHPDCRRSKVGFSLLDMLLTTVSDRFSSQSGYDFVDPANSPVYRADGRESRPRQYFRLYLSYFVRHKHRTDGDQALERKQKAYDVDLRWVKKLLEERFNFTEIVRFEAARRSAKARKDLPVCWLDEVVFEHTCFFDPEDALTKPDY
ncbi:uncharacterized protein THITE_42167 [Thermothielavioides terrestris NRRL 8126]|uniref:N-acetyltransferase domain-containing protein n=1 Tax=Thermothielavioides terrestris (strain ATCC 38088 / NRRL 8126) TaxID=578455 RepID=G2RB44_THETT|nr:uncharacterized protein THITE_42167 [Thermothielavioides terrestris NRRL 8126]AEO69015.1 hypothetical protein THITE_42167 [Thermothielavioides terrestris NRRL 8126]